MSEPREDADKFVTNLLDRLSSHNLALRTQLDEAVRLLRVAHRAYPSVSTPDTCQFCAFLGTIDGTAALIKEEPQ